MKLTTVLFDLDGTLLPMDNDSFTKEYFKLLCKKVVPLGYDPDELVAAIWKGTAAMVANDGVIMNDKAFWKTFAEIMGERVYDDMPVFDEFYRSDFNEAQHMCGKNETLIALVHDLKARGFKVALATNPIFPATATENRIRWAGFEPEDFELYTTYENIGYSKPNLEYYKEITKRLSVQPQECLMVGNDVGEDLVAAQIGMRTFLLTDHVINRKNEDISQQARGSADQLRIHIDYLASLE